MTSPVDEWIRTLEARHMADLTFSEVARALRALSSAYVERRGRLREGAALSGAGKRAAFALFYAPLHWLLIQHIVNAIGATRRPIATLVDLGCGTGAAGSAWAMSLRSAPRVIGIDRHPWALSEAAATYRHFGLPFRTIRGDFGEAHWPRSPAAFVAAFAVNELTDAARDSALPRLVDRGRRGDSVLIVEPLAGFVAPWWQDWREAAEKIGGRTDEWRFRVELPPIVARLDRAAGLNHAEVTGRSIWIG